ncbi:MAG: class I SAM-dependent methyltransferase [Bacteroidota bacterium]
MEFIDSKLDEYVCSHTSDESELLYDLNRETHLQVLNPRMLSGHFQGRFLSMISKMIQPKNILEIGTYTGYSCLCLLEGLASTGKITTIDCNEELEDIVRKYIDKAQANTKINYLIGDAMEIVPNLNEEFDLVFIDADKNNYVNYFNLVIDKVKSGGFILTDNVLWSGKVLEELKPNDLDTKAILEFNSLMKNDPRVETILLPIRDGLMITRKK